MKVSKSSQKMEDGDANLGTDSIAKGVFVFKKMSSKSKRRSRKSMSSGTAVLPSSFFGTEHPGLKSSRCHRSDVYRESVGRLCDHLRQIQQEIFAQALEEVTRFVQGPDACSLAKTIPTCVLLTGVNMPDHDSLFRLLHRTLLSSVSTHVASVSSLSSPSLKALLFHCVSQLMFQDSAAEVVDSDDDDDDEEEVDDDEEEEQEEKPKRRQKPLAGIKASSFGVLPKLKRWYENQYVLHCGDKKPPLMFILEDFEAFPPVMLQNFIQLLRMYCHQLPIILILGVSTTMDAVHRALPHSVTKHLALHKIASQPSIQILDRFMKTVMTSRDIPFRLGSKILQIVLENFAFCDLSVSNVLTVYKWCLLEHFSSRPISMLCVTSADQRRTLMDQVTEWELQLFMNVPSFKKLVASNPAKYVHLLTDSQAFRQFLLSHVDKLWQRIHTFDVIVGCLHAMAVGLPPDTLAQSFYSVYCSCLDEPITESQEYRRTFMFLQVSERTDLAGRLTAVHRHLSDFVMTNPDLVALLSRSETILKEVQDFEQKKNDSPSKVATVSPSKSSSRARAATSRFEFKQKMLQDMKDKKSHGDQANPFVELRSRILKFWHKTFEMFLGPNAATSCLPSKQPFHEIMLFDDLLSMRSSLIGDHRDALQTALLNPHYYLQNEALQVQKLDDILPSFPDSCIAYKLHLECGRYVNLYDWLQCWLSVVSCGDPAAIATPKGSRTHRRHVPELEEDDKALNVDPVNQARFSRAVSELQFLGFIRSSRRKTDHVERLTFNA